jgi:hypothetical protein
MSTNAHASKEQTYYMPSDTVSADEWSCFDNVYQVHCPKIFMNNAIRDVSPHSQCRVYQLIAKDVRF